MTVTIQLCGGLAEGQTIELRERPIQWRVPVPRPYSRFWELDNDPSRIPEPSFDVVLYLDTNIRTQEGHILYATAGLFEQLRMAVRHQARFLADLVRSPPDLEPELEPVTAEDAPLRPGWLAKAEMSGKSEYPFDAIKREDTERLIAQIDEVTDAGA
jgi:hypothetical protein